MAKREKRVALNDEQRLKIEGRLRSIVDSSPIVNAIRASSIGSLRLAVSMEDVPAVAMQQEFIDPKSRAPKPEKGTSNEAAMDEIDIQGFAVLAGENSPLKNSIVTGRRGRVCTIRGSQEEIRKLSLDPNVVSIRLADSVKVPIPLDGAISDGSRRTERPPVPEYQRGDRRHGENVLVGIIDVGGFDFSHPDFLNSDGTTRFVSIWDQAEDGFRDPPSARPLFRDSGGQVGPATANFDYGSELTADDLNSAIADAGLFGLPAYELEPQSQMVRGSHATHVASIAAGNGSFCNKAKIAGVLLSLAPGDTDRRRSFYDTTRIAHAIEYLFKLAKDPSLGVDAVSINISLGTNGGPHDDSSPMSRWIDFGLTEPGRSVCVAAGNAGQEAPRHQGDIGFTLGRIHTSGRLGATDLENELDWIVVGNGESLQDISENELEIWYPPQDRVAVQIRPPGGNWSTVVEPGEFIKNKVLGEEHNFTVISVYNELYDVGNGHNRITVYLSPFIADDSIRSIAPGTWKVRLIGQHVRDGRYHGWIERDDPAEIGRVDSAAFWRFPSFFADGTNVDNSSLSTLACGDRIVAVANLDAKNRKINVSSSQGPTRDGREKPDIAAPGTEIWAANGFDSEPWIQKTGTSMASPFGASVAGLILSNAPQLTASQVLGIIRRSAKPLPGHSYDWRDDAGFGEIDVNVCLQEARLANRSLQDIEKSESNEGDQ